MTEDIYKKMAKDFFKAIGKSGLYLGLKNTKGIFCLRKAQEETYAYAVSEKSVKTAAGDKTIDCLNFYHLCEYFGIDVERGEFHGMDEFMKVTNAHSKTIDGLIKEFSEKDLAVIYAERKLSKKEAKIMSEFEVPFWYIGILKFKKDGNFKEFCPE